MMCSRGSGFNTRACVSSGDRTWYRPYEADVRRIAGGRGMGMFGVGFVHHPMKANTAGEDAATVELVENIKQFVQSNDDKVATSRLSFA